MSGIRADRGYSLTYSKASLLLLPLLSFAVAADASAQVVSAGDGAGTVVDANGAQFDISGGAYSDNNANLFHNFEQFGLSSGQTANFETIPDVQNVVGRVGGGQASTIDGTLQVSGSDASLYLVNPAGILMGPDAQLNLSGGFTATTATGVGFENGQFDANTTDYEPLTGEPSSFEFANEQAGAVVNSGDLSVAAGNAIGLIGGTVVNTGRLSAPEGTVTIAAVEGENRVRISQGDQLLSLEVDAVDPSQTVPTISAQSIGSMLTGSGLSEATALITNPDGTIRLGSGVVDESGGSTITAGNLSTAGDVGGNINVLGDRIDLVGANIDASGTNEGGVVRIGGDYRGEGKVVNATQTLFDSNSVVSADALDNGDGGRVIVWADDVTKFFGNISARGGAEGGDGGFVEVSGKERLVATGDVDLRSPQGRIGTVLLDPENIVVTDELPTPPDDDITSYLTSNYVENLSNSADVVLEAKNNFTIRSLSDGELFFQPERAVTFKANSDGIGAGDFSMDLGDTIRAEKGNVTISGAGITVGTIDTSTDQEDDHGAASSVQGGDVTLDSTLGIVAQEILTYGARDGDRPGSGGNVTLNALDGDVVINDAIKTYSATGDDEARNGGFIDIYASESIRVGTAPSTEDVLDASSRAYDDTSGLGGFISLEAANGDITVAGNISAQSTTVEEQDIEDHGYVQGGGAVEIIARQGSISVGDISTSAKTGRDDDDGNAGNGGAVTLSAGMNITASEIDTTSISDGDTSGESGAVKITAGNYIRTETVTTDSRAESNVGKAGKITFNAQSIDISGGLSSVKIESGVASNNGDFTNSIKLIGDRVEFGNGLNSVRGYSIDIVPLTASQDINIGNSNNNDPLALSITNSEISAIGNNVTSIAVGRSDSTGTVRLAPSVTSANALSRAPLNILGAGTLVGSNEDTTYRINGSNRGSIDGNATTKFFSVANLQGGSGKDDFFIMKGVPANSFGELGGGGGTNTLNYQNFTVGLDVSLSGLSDVEILMTSSLGQVNTLTGADADSDWNITGVNSGSVSNGISFEGFSNLIGGSKVDRFVIEDDGSLTGEIIGGVGSDFLSYEKFSGSADVNLQDRTGSSIRSFSQIENFVGSEQAGGILVGTDEADIFKITGDRAGNVETLSYTFSNFDVIDGKDATDILDYSDYVSAIEVDLEAMQASGLSSFAGIESIKGSRANDDAIRGRQNDDNTFEILASGSGVANGSLNFSEIEKVRGGSALDTLDLSGYGEAVEVEIGNSRALGVIEFEGIEKFVGNGDGSIIKGTDDIDIFELTGDRTGTINNTTNNQLSFSNFGTINGMGGKDLFDLGTPTTGGKNTWTVDEVGGGFLNASTSRIVTFKNFEQLEGNNDEDFFNLANNGAIETIVGKDGANTISYGSRDGSISVDFQNRTATGIAGQFFDIRSFIGSSSSNGTLSGLDSGSRWTVAGTNSGAVDGVAFANFDQLLGKSGDDTFAFGSDGIITGSIEAGAGRDELNYSNYDGTVELYFDRVLDERGNAITANFSEVEKIFGGRGNNTLYSSMENNRFEAPLDGGLRLGDRTFFGIDRISGSSTDTVLDYSQVETATVVDLENSQIVNGPVFENIRKIIGSDRSANNNSVLGKAGDDQFVIVGDREIETEGLTLSQFSTVNGDEGDNRFIVNQASSSNVLIEGGSDNLESRNLIISEVANANWQVGAGKNAGRLEAPDGSVLAEFSQIQKLENNTSGGVHRVTFTAPDSQITGSIDSGDSGLILRGNDINVGNNYGDRNLVGGEISGSGTLTILSRTADVGIELGGNDSQGDTLNITDGEIAAIQDGFSQVTIGDKTLTNSLRFRGDASFRSAVTLQSRGTIDADGYRLSAEGEILVESDRISASAIDSGEGVSLVASEDISANAISAGGQGVDIESVAGGIVVDGEIATSGQQLGNGVRLNAQKAIAVGNITTEGGENSGSVNISSVAGGISAGGISTSSRNGSATSSTVSGGVTLGAKDDVEVAFIDASGLGDRTSESGFIKIETTENFVATGSIAGTNTSLSTAGIENGTIDIRYGNPNRPEKPFLVGQASDNGTAGSIRAALEIVSGDVPSGLSQGNITITDLGYQLAEPREPVAPLQIIEPIPEQASAGEVITSNSDNSSKEILSNLEAGVGEEFKDYLNLPENGKQQKVATLGGMQQTLRTVEETTGTTPALVYVYFVPDAASEASVASQEAQVDAPDDQLEVMMINVTGEPVRKRQWGITRAQVEAASLNLREQITSQFTSATQYLEPAQQLYDWIIRPIAGELEKNQVESVGFVMDTGLRTMPLAALHDGDRYLVEHYSLGLMPTFSLTEFEDEDAVEVDFEAARVLAMGASEFENQPDLPAVDAEVKLITQGKWEGDAFLNEDFVRENLQNQIKDRDYGVVHLATHASFEAGDLEKSYIQLWDEKLALDDIGELGLDKANIGLIILSACNTALGDRASEYGFAGFAVTSGSQSALASLWPVNDEGTLGFMSQFYGELKQAPVRTEALRQAQMSLIRGEVGIDTGVVYDAAGDEIAVLPSLAESGRWDFSHPFFWSAFTMIGNPW